jgi:hypothetical protein
MISDVDHGKNRWPRQVRMSDEEYRQACADAEAAGLDFGKYVRKALRDLHERRAREDLARFVEHVAEVQARIQPLVPNVDPHDLNLILSNIGRPVAQRRFFLRRRGDHYVF